MVHILYMVHRYGVPKIINIDTSFFKLQKTTEVTFVEIRALSSESCAR